MLERGKCLLGCLHDGWIGANRPMTTGRVEHVTSTDGVTTAMGFLVCLLIFSDTKTHAHVNCNCATAQHLAR